MKEADDMGIIENLASRGSAATGNSKSLAIRTLQAK
jgi:hypothetical protein